MVEYSGGSGNVKKVPTGLVVMLRKRKERK
jgi:hypothetical protein